MKSRCRLLLLTILLWGWSPANGQTNSRLDTILSEISEARIRADIETLVSFKTRHTLSDTSSDRHGIGAARRWIFREFSSLVPSSQGRLTVWFDETMMGPSRRVREPVRVTNVVAKLLGSTSSDPANERVIIVGAHYDSRALDVMDAVTEAPGANDDGSGTAVVLELARVMSRYRFDATIVFVAFAGEEQGLLGSTAFAEKARREGWNIEAMLNNDMVGNVESADGRIDSSSVRLFAEALTPLDTGGVLKARRALGLENDGLSRTLGRAIGEIGRRYVQDLDIRLIYRRDRFLRGGDHSPFHDRGFAAIRFVESKENTDRQHRNPVGQGETRQGDLPSFVQCAYVAKIARLNAAVLVTLASGPRIPEAAEIVLGGPVHATTLRWSPNREADLEGYLVRVRPTTSSEWERSVFTTDTTIILDACKDDVLFGVQAVDRDGFASLPALPSPGR